MRLLTALITATCRATVSSSANKYLHITKDSIMDDNENDPDELSIDDRIDAQRDLIRQSLDEVTPD